MNRIPRTRFVTLMAAAAGVSAGLASMTTPSQAMANTQPTAAVASDTAKAKPAPAPAKAAPAPAKTAGAPNAKAAEAKPAAKPVVATAGPNNPAPDDACEDEADCRNANGDGRGY